MRTDSEGHHIYELNDFTDEEVARENELYVAVATGLNICMLCGDIADIGEMTHEQIARHSKYSRANVEVPNADITADEGDRRVYRIRTPPELYGVSHSPIADDDISISASDSPTSDEAQAALLSDEQIEVSNTSGINTNDPQQIKKALLSDEDLLVAFFTDGEYMVYDDKHPRGATMTVLDGCFMLAREDGPPTLASVCDFHSAERLSDHAVIEWQEDSQTWSVY